MNGSVLPLPHFLVIAAADLFQEPAGALVIRHPGHALMAQTNGFLRNRCVNRVYSMSYSGCGRPGGRWDILWRPRKKFFTQRI